MTRSLQAAALRYAAKGWPVFLLSRTKQPVALCPDCDRHRRQRTPHDREGCRCLMCHGFYAATLDPQAIGRMYAVEPRGTLAVRTGAPSRLVVIDVDPDAGGMQSLARLVRDGWCPPTRYVRTGSGGLHLYYRHPGAQMRVPCDQGKRLGPGVDVRGDGGYAVLPPAIHYRTGRPYAWRDESAPVEEMAPALRAALTADCPRPHNPPPNALSPGHRYAGRSAAGVVSHPERLMDALLARLCAAPRGQRRTTLYGCARGAARVVATGAYTPHQARDLLLGVCEREGWDVNTGTRDAIDGGFQAEGVLG